MSFGKLKDDFSKGLVPKADFINQAYEFHQSLYEYSKMIADTEISKIEITKNLVVATIRDPEIKLIVNQDDKRTAPIEILNFNFYEPEIASMMKALIGDGDTVLDVGANIGYYSLVLAKLFPKSEIYSFEPIDDTFKRLLANIELNATRNVHPFKFGLSDKEEQKTFYFYPSGSVNASAANLTGGQDVQKVSCEVKTLDQFSKSEHIQVDFIKCDVEGAELFVFEGGIETLKRDKPIILTEMLRKWTAPFDYHPNQIIQLLKEIGYQCYSTKNLKLSKFEKMDEHTVETNFFFLDPVKHAAKLKRVLQ